MLKELIGGIAYANVLEYAWHRWLLHARNDTELHARHLAHHAASDPGHIVTAPVVGLYAANIAAAVGLFGWRRAVKLAIVWTAYLAALEGSHEMIHAGRMPKFLARTHEIHHNRPDRRFNVFLPFGDWIFRTV